MTILGEPWWKAFIIFLVLLIPLYGPMIVFFYGMQDTHGVDEYGRWRD